MMRGSNKPMWYLEYRRKMTFEQSFELMEIRCKSLSSSVLEMFRGGLFYCMGRI
jgi:hypothetical protein